MAGRLGEGAHHELRIHGVAGTPPEGMLDDLLRTWPAAGPCGPNGSSTDLSVWRRDPDRRGLRAYSWSSVTSGSARSALYLLLVPHLLVNLAGWSALPTGPAGAAGLADPDRTRSGAVRAVTAGVRLLALILTVIMAQWALLVALDLVAYQWAVRIRELPPWTLGVGVLTAGLAVELVLLVTRLHLRPAMERATDATPLTDPVGYAWLTGDQHLLWSSPSTITLQRHAHHGVALGSIALVAVAMVGGWVAMPQPWAAAATLSGGIAVALGVAVLTQHSLSTGRPGAAGWTWMGHLSRAAGRLGVLLAAGAAAGVTLTGPAVGSVTAAMVEGLDSADLGDMAAAGQPIVLPAIRDVGMGLTLGYTAGCLAVGLLAWVVRGRTARPGGSAAGSGMQPFNLPGLALLAGAAGGGMGAALAAAVSRVLGNADAVVVPGPMPEALGIAFAALAVLLGWVVVIGLAAHTRQVEGTWRVVLTTAVHRLLRQGSWLSATLTVLALLGVAMITVLVRSPDNPLHVLQGADPLPQLIVLAAAGLVAGAVGLVLAAVTGRQSAGLITGLVLLAAAAVAVAQAPGDQLARQLRPAAMAVGLLTPAGFVLGKGISALRRRSDRRTVAILWDVGTFLPRWFDPLSPPSYGDAVVTDLQGLIAEQLGTDGADGHPRTLLLAPHSQGTVIAAAALLGLPAAVPTDRLALLTYGSPLRHLYAEFFPRLFDPSAFAALHDRLGGRWRNLARASDPIGAPVGLDGVDVLLTDDPCSRGHSAYPREAAYDAAVTELQAALGIPLRIPDRGAPHPPARPHHPR